MSLAGPIILGVCGLPGDDDRGHLATMTRTAEQSPKDIAVESTDIPSLWSQGGARGKDGDRRVLGRLPRGEDIGIGALMDEEEFTKEFRKGRGISRHDPRNINFKSHYYKMSIRNLENPYLTQQSCFKECYLV